MKKINKYIILISIIFIILFIIYYVRKTYAALGDSDLVSLIPYEDDIALEIDENNTSSTKKYLLKAKLYEQNKFIKIGKNYSDNIKIGIDSENIIGKKPAAVRAKIYKYWCDYESMRIAGLDPSFINPNLNYNDESGWVINDNETTSERTTLYYNRLLTVDTYDQETSSFINGISINDAVLSQVRYTSNNGTITAVNPYEKLYYCIYIEVDTVEGRNTAGIQSVWGITPTSIDLDTGDIDWGF